jgi:TPR repeat protein
MRNSYRVEKERMAQRNVGANARRGPLSTVLLTAGVAMLGLALVDPAPALDVAAGQTAAPTAPLPMFKDPRAALRAGLESYHAGDPGASVEALRYAAEGGETLAQWKLGSMYAQGDGVARDETKAYDYFSRLVEHFSATEPNPNERPLAASAFVAVGAYLRNGLSDAKIAPDVERAFDLFRYAATYFGDADAQYNLGRMYLEGAGVRRDARQSMNWLELAARKGHPQAQAVLGRVMFNGEAGATQQRSRGLMYLTLARDSVAATASEQWIVDLHSQALQTASEDERKTAIGLLEAYLRERNN